MSSNILCADLSTLHFFELFFDQELIKIIVEETNRKSVQFLNTTTLEKNSPVHRWKETDDYDGQDYGVKNCEVGLCISPYFKMHHTLRNF